jgi:hypothetical protein
MGLVQAGLAIAEVEAAASRDLIGHGEECRLAITLKEILQAQVPSQGLFFAKSARKAARSAGSWISSAMEAALRFSEVMMASISCAALGHKGENRHQKGTSENPPAHSTVPHERFKAF